jgi:hypothetical protein
MAIPHLHGQLAWSACIVLSLHGHTGSPACRSCQKKRKENDIYIYKKQNTPGEDRTRDLMRVRHT